jgi:arylsulfatase A-like enzyme/Tfp pilus assembly protein PilF
VTTGSKIAAAAVVVLGIAVGAWWGTRPPIRPKHVVLITLDTLRADRIGAYGYAAGSTPHLDAIARAGVRFDQAVSPAPITGPAHAGIFTGQYPARLGVRDNATTPLPDSAVTLAERLAANGYDTAGFIGAFILDRPYGFAQGFATFSGFTRVESGRETNVERSGSEVVDAALQWLSARQTDQPFFLWVHLYDPHAPYAPPAPYATQFADRPYDGEVAFADAQVGRLRDALRSQGLDEETLMVALADHGESLGEHGEDEHGVFLYEPVMRIPWLMSGPGIAAGTAIPNQVRALDVMPTIMAALGLPVSDPIDGVSVWPLLRGTTGAPSPAAYAESFYPKFHYGWSELRSVRADGWKVIDAPNPELYNLTDDPGELRNLYATQQALADRMIAEAARLDREFTGGAPVVATPPDRDTLERLRSLGYIGTSSTTLPAGERGPDPKDRIEERREFKVRLSAAIDDLRGGRVPAAIEQFKRLIGINPKAYDLHQFLGEAYQTVGQLPQALGEYEYAAVLNPASTTPVLAAAEVHLAMGNIGAARQRRDQAAALDPQSFDVSVVSGRIFEAEGRASEAIAAYLRAVSQNGANPRPRMLIVGVASRLQQYDLAESQLQTLLSMGYRPSRIHFALGQLAQLRGRIDVAEQHYRQALTLEPGLPMAVEGLRQIKR